MNNNNLINYFDLFPFPQPTDIIPLIDKGLRESYDLAAEKEYIFPDDIKKKIKNVLIVGCGCNQLIYHSIRNPKIKFVGVDFSEIVANHVTKTIKDHNIKNAKFLKDDFINLSSETYDVIFALDVINYSKDPQLSLNFLSSILNDNGSIILSLPASHYQSSIDDTKNVIKELNLSYKSKEDVDYAFNLVKSLISLHPSRVNAYQNDGWISDDDFVYRFMSPKNHSFNVYQIDDLLKGSNLFFQNWFYNSNYFPRAFFWDENPKLPNIINKFDGKNILDIWDEILAIKGPHLTVRKHTFCARKDVNLNYYTDLMNDDESFVYIRPHHIISENTTQTGTIFARTNYKRLLKDNEAKVLAELSKPLKIKNLLKRTDFSIDELNAILQNLWEYSAISYYKG